MENIKEIRNKPYLLINTYIKLRGIPCLLRVDSYNPSWATFNVDLPDKYFTTKYDNPMLTLDYYIRNIEAVYYPKHNRLREALANTPSFSL